MTIYTTQPDGTDGIDTGLNQQQPTVNSGTDTTHPIGYNTGSSNLRRMLLKFDFTKGTNPPNIKSIIDSAVLTIRCTTYATTKTLATFQVLRNWVEAQATWNVYSTGNNWGTAGCSNTASDYVNTDLGNVSVSATGSYDITFNASGLAIVQGWIDGSIANYGLLLKHTIETGDQNDYASSDNATASYRPKLVLNWHPAWVPQIWIF